MTELMFFVLVNEFQFGCIGLFLLIDPEMSHFGFLGWLACVLLTVGGFGSFLATIGNLVVNRISKNKPASAPSMDDSKDGLYDVIDVLKTNKLQLLRDMHRIDKICRNLGSDHLAAVDPVLHITSYWESCWEGEKNDDTI